MNNIKLMTRIKPILNNNKNRCVKFEGNKIIIKKKQSGCYKERLVKYEYDFDRVFDDNKKNIDIFNEISIDMLYNLIKKKKNIVFYVYGETGSGKTHTIFGNCNEEGYLKLFLQDLISMDLSVKISIIQIYNNKFFDILNGNQIINQRENGGQEFKLSPLKEQIIENDQQIENIKQCIINHRRVGISAQNDTSSRTHLCIIIHANGKTIKILDLAGCEKASQSICINKKMFLENGNINQSLFNLKECIRSLVLKKKHIPYRRCELTKFLKTSFHDSCKTFILSTINQNYKNLLTNIDVMNYITDIKRINIPSKLVLPSIKNKFIESPTFKHFQTHKSLFGELQVMEENILNQIFETKTTKFLLKDYINVIEKKQDIIQEYSTKKNVFPEPPLLQNINPAPRNKKRGIKERDIKSS